MLNATDFATKEKKFNEYRSKKETIRIKLKDVADKIFLENSKIEKLKMKIDKLKKDIDSQKEIEKEKSRELEEYQKNIEIITTSQEEIKKSINAIIAKEFSLSILRKNSKLSLPNHLIQSEILKKLQKMLEKKFFLLKQRYIENRLLLDEYQAKRDKIRNYIKKLEIEKDNLETLNEKYSESVEKLKEEKYQYINELAKISKEEVALKETLNKLKILKKNPKEKEEYVNLNNIKVRKIGSSFKRIKVRKYSGKKTIPPIENYKIIKRFGIYRDPIYNIKIFNETMILRSPKSDALVRSIFKGKVVFAKDTKVLGKIVIVECKNNMNVIYGHLSKIPSHIKVGAVVKKGAVIGRIKRDLTFGITQKNRHINPLQVIK